MKTVMKMLPLLMIVLMVASSYKIISTATEKSKLYNGHLEAARTFASKGIIVDAVKEYDEALNMYKSKEVCLEIGKMYNDNEMGGDAVSWGEKMMEMYPDEPFAYEYTLNSYIKYDNFEECYSIIEVAEKRGVSSKEIKKIAESLEYKYELKRTDFSEISVYSGELCAVKKGDFWGYVDEKGTVAIPYKYYSAGIFANGIASVQQEENGEIFYIDIYGNKKLDIPDNLNCKYAGAFSNDMLLLSDGSKYSYYNVSFEKLFGPYDYATVINGGVAAIKNGGEWSLINSTAERIGKDTYSDVKLDEKNIAFRNERAFVKIGDKYYMVDAEGKKVSGKAFEDAKLFKEDAPAAIKIDGKWGFVNKEGKIVIEPEYDDAKSFSNGLAAVLKDGEWFYIDMNNAAKIKDGFDNAADFNGQGMAFIHKEGHWYILKLLNKNH